MIVLDLPAPLSVNRTRRINWAASRDIENWKKLADNLVMSQGRLPRPITGPFGVTLVYPETSPLDADNGCKIPIDYLRRLELIADDNPKFMRQVLLKFGEAPEGCRVTVEPWGGA